MPTGSPERGTYRCGTGAGPVPVGDGAGRVPVGDGDGPVPVGDGACGVRSETAPGPSRSETAPAASRSETATGPSWSETAPPRPGRRRRRARAGRRRRRPVPVGDGDGLVRSETAPGPPVGDGDGPVPVGDGDGPMAQSARCVSSSRATPQSGQRPADHRVAGLHGDRRQGQDGALEGGTRIEGRGAAYLPEDVAGLGTVGEEDRGARIDAEGGARRGR